MIAGALAAALGLAACAPGSQPAGEVRMSEAPGTDTAGEPAVEPDPVRREGVTACPGGVSVPLAGPSATVPALGDPAEAALGSDPTPRQVHLAWTGNPATTATILWRTDDGTRASRVELGTDLAYGTEVVGASFRVQGASEWPRVHEVRICGLEPATTYHYRVGVEPALSPDYAFTTGPAPGGDEVVTFAVAGDTRNAPATWAAILAASEARGVDFRLFSGDAVGSGEDVSEWDEWFDAGVGRIESTVTVPAHGNHENYAQPYFALNGMPGNERWFSLDYGPVHLAVVDDQLDTDAEWMAQAEWLAADLAAAPQRWKFVAHHEPAFSSSLVHATNASVAEWIVPVEEAGGVDIDFAGHNHHYERTVPIRGGARDDRAGVTYVITGGGGAPLYENDGAEWYTDVAVVSQHYVLVRVEGRVLTLLVYDLGGNLLDSHVLQK